MTVLLRTLADGLIHMAEERPRQTDSARLLRDAAASLLDADEALERERSTPTTTQTKGYYGEAR